MRSVTWCRTYMHIHQPPQSKTQRTVSCQQLLYRQLPPCTWRLSLKLCAHPYSWPGGPQPLQLRGVPNPPTITTKCPRKEYCVNEEVRQKPKRPKALSALSPQGVPETPGGGGAHTSLAALCKVDSQTPLCQGTLQDPAPGHPGPESSS